MKILVTGATGFIGSHFLNAALSEGHEVIGLRRTIDSKPRIELINEPSWLTKQLDEVTVEDLIDVDAVVHLAAHSMTPPYDTLLNCLYWNVQAPIKLVEEAIKAKVKRYVVAGSCFEYGLSGERYDFIPVDAPLEPTLTYSASKAAASIAFSQLAHQKKISLAYYRIFHVFGEGESESRLYPALKKAAMSGKDFDLTKGEQIRDFVPVADVVNRLLRSCADFEKGTPEVGVCNLGSGTPQSIKSFSEYWWGKWKAKGKLCFGAIPYRENEVMRYVPLIEK